MPLDMVKDGDTDIQDLLRGDAALLDAAKKGCLARVQKLCSPENINCRDTQGRNSTPLHLAGTPDSSQLSQNEQNKLDFMAAKLLPVWVGKVQLVFVLFFSC